MLGTTPNNVALKTTAPNSSELDISEVVEVREETEKGHAAHTKQARKLKDCPASCAAR